MDFLNGFTMFQKVMWFIAVPSSIFFIIQVALIFFGMDSDSDMDMDTDVDTDVDSAQTDAGATFAWFSFKNLISFFAVFGWTGLICIEAVLPQGWSIFLATLAGLLMVFIMTGLMFLMNKLQSNPTMKVKDAIGRECTVYLRIPEKNEGKGQVNIVLNGALQTMSAVSNDKAYKRDNKVKVIGITDSSELIVSNK